MIQIIQIKKNENFLEPLNLDNIENEKKNYFDEKWKKNIENTYIDVKNNQNNLKEKFLENKFREKMEKKIEKEIYNNEYSEIYKKIKNEIFLNIKNELIAKKKKEIEMQKKKN